MAANDVQILTIIVPNPQYDNSKSARVVAPPLAYATRISTGFQTLSSNNPNNYDTIEGLVYLPTLPASAGDVCASAQSVIPANVTTIANFPANQGYPLIAVFPWTDSTDCTEAYLSQARADAVRGAITFQQNSGAVPLPGDSSWSLRDGGAWKSANQYPIYGINAAAALTLLQEMAAYSGNATSVPNGTAIADQFGSRDFPRLFAHVDLQGVSGVPSLWIFLIIVLAVLLGIVVSASIIMHLIQRHQRKVLQRRLERGDVDLEALGIKKMNVPQEKIDQMPKYIYTDGTAPIEPTLSSKHQPSQQPHLTSFSQTTCPICLEDFVSNETEVRELPCKHIFHPECIDLFLRDNSSLCPMCKKSALPPGYCPVKVTNLMVRRERLVRRMRVRRQQITAAAIARSGDAPPPPPAPTSRAGAVGMWIQRRLRVGAGIPGIAAERTGSTRARMANTPGEPQQTEPSATNTQDLELGQVSPPDSTNTQTQAQSPAPLTMRTAYEEPAAPTPTAFNLRRQTIAVPAHVNAQGATARRAWRRERLARQQDAEYNEQAQTARQIDVGRPLWRRVVGRIAPGFD